MSITAPPPSNTIKTATPDAGSGIPGGRSLPPAGRNGNIRCFGNNLSNVTPAAVSTNDDNPPVGADSTQLSYDGVPPVGMTAIGDNSGANVVTQLSLDSDGAADASAHPGRIS
jgi:hypothetical protein